MAYPSALDTTTQLPNSFVDATPTAVVHSLHHDTLADAVIAIEAELGTLPKGSYTDVKTRLNDSLNLTPAADQIVRPSADKIAVATRNFLDIQTSNAWEHRNAAGTTKAYLTPAGVFSAQGLSIAGTPLASGHLSDAASLLYGSAANVFTAAQSISVAGGKTTLALTSTGANTGLTVGGDTNLYRSAADSWKTDDAIEIAGGAGTKTALQISSTTVNTGLTIGGDATLYRSAASTLKTDGALVVGGLLSVASAGIHFNDGTTQTTAPVTAASVSLALVVALS